MAWDVPNFSIPVQTNYGAQIAGLGDRLISAYDSGQASRRQQDMLNARKALGEEMARGGQPNYQALGARALGAGDLEGANTFMRLGQQQVDNDYRRQGMDLQRQQIGLQERQYNEKPPAVSAVPNQQGQDQANQWNPQTRQWEPIGGPKRPPAPSGYAYREDGSVAPIPGGPEDPITQQRMRVKQALDAGLHPSSPAFKAFVLTGKMPREDASPLTATDKKAILEADDAVAANQAAIDNLGRAQQLSGQALAGTGAGTRAWIGNNLPDWVVPDFVASPQQAQATSELTNTVTSNALQQLKAIFGAAPTEGERKILMEIQGAANQPQPVREAIYKRAAEMAQRRLEFNRQRAAALRGGTFYQNDPASTGANPNSAPAPLNPDGSKNQSRAPGGAPAVGQVDGGAPVRVSSPAEARRLPSGTRIALPDGTEGVVP